MEDNRTRSRLPQGNGYDPLNTTVPTFYCQILTDTHGELSANMMLTCHKVFPLLKRLQSEWETLCDDDKYFPVKHALDAGLKNMAKWYRKTDNTSIYFISHGIVFLFFMILICFDQNVTVLDPMCKLSYLNIVWEPEFIEAGMTCLREIVGFFILLQTVGILT